jgi:hypothetical protein
MHSNPSGSWQFSAGRCFFHLYRPLSSLVCQICVFRGVCGFVVVLSRFHHKRISPSVVRMWNKFQPLCSPVESFLGYIRLSTRLLRNQLDVTHSVKEAPTTPIHHDCMFFQVDRIPSDTFLIEPVWKDEKSWSSKTPALAESLVE